MITPRYQRSLSPSAEALLSPGSPLRVLVDHDWVADHLDPEAIDVHLRENDELMLYHGTTRLLVAALGKGVQFAAHARYRALCGEKADQLLRKWQTPITPAVAQLIREYVPLAVQKIDDHNQRYYNSECEGRWQNRLGLIWGRRWTSAYPWTVFDRECVLGFANDGEKQEFLSPLATPYLAVKESLQHLDPVKWGRPDHALDSGDDDDEEGAWSSSKISNEVDFLAIDADGQLVCIELKRGQNTSGIYWGPLQVGLYRDAFDAALPSIRADLQKVIQQRISLGLLPESATRGLADTALRSVTAALVVAVPNEKSSCWAKLDEVQARLPARMRVPVYEVTWGSTSTQLRRRFE
jgi:hypothetical protein